MKTTQKKQKILAIQFKYFGDAVFITPALRALKEHAADVEIHVLIAAEIAPLLENIPWIHKVWPMPRTRGKFRLKQTWPLIRALRQEKFDRAVDFGGNDRGALLSALSGAPIRLSYKGSKTKILQNLCYTQTVLVASLPQFWIPMHIQLLAAWGIKAPRSPHLELVADQTLAEAAKQYLPDNTILCHLATSQTKKEWPLSYWQALHQKAQAAGYKIAFSSGTNAREKQLLSDLQTLDSTIIALPALSDIRLFLAVLSRAKLLIAGDTGPLHFASGLGVPVIGLYATGDSIARAAPNYPEIAVIKAPQCACDIAQLELPDCMHATPCMSLIQPEEVLARIKLILQTA